PVWSAVLQQCTRSFGHARIDSSIRRAMSRFFHYDTGRLYCEGVPAADLVAAHGTPLYVYSRASIVERFCDFERAFAGVERLICYSVKANGNLAILRLLAEQGSGADIVSGGELHRARLAGIPADRIVFSGVGKTITEQAAALEAGIYGFNVESESELWSLSQLANTMNVRAPIAIRVNPDIESPTPHQYTRTGHLATKFGVPMADAPRLYRLAASLPGLWIRGVDVHIGSQILEVEPYRLALMRVLELVGQLRSEGITLEYIDLGGGFGVSYEGEPGPNAAHFAAALIPELGGTGLRVILEPGRYILAPSGVLLTRVLTVKESAAKNFVITDAGMNDLLRPSHYASYHHIASAEQHSGRDRMHVDVVGPICETGDFLALDRELERVLEGELLVVGTAGAYGFSMASNYNARPRPGEVLVDGERFTLIRKRETYDDLVRGEIELLD
ncbi:MAG TPA: diaminopimelate decarboxylase, partial [Longimicrobiales bacterium]|nr:diaminopimelate decarboxylase [Longimicrobiales bacterium]